MKLTRKRVAPAFQRAFTAPANHSGAVAWTGGSYVPRAQVTKVQRKLAPQR